MAMSLVATTTLAARNTATITFTNIPQTGKDLLCKFALRGSNTEIFITLNSNFSDTGKMLRNIDGTVTSINVNGDRAGWIAQDAYTANTFGNGEAYVSNYAGTANKSMSIDTVSENNSTTIGMSIAAQVFTSSTGITSLTLDNGGGQLLEIGSTASLYIIS
jgi:hypothetical protein